MMAMMWWGTRFADRKPRRRPRKPRGRARLWMRVGVAAAVVVLLAGDPASALGGHLQRATPEVRRSLCRRRSGRGANSTGRADWQPSVAPAGNLAKPPMAGTRAGRLAITFYPPRAMAAKRVRDNRPPRAWKPWTSRRFPSPAGRGLRCLAHHFGNGENVRVVLTWYQSGDCITAAGCGPSSAPPGHGCTAARHPAHSSPYRRSGMIRGHGLHPQRTRPRRSE